MVAVVVPAYNEGKLIGKTLQSIPPLVDRIYAVDDSSTDNTLEEIRRSAKYDSRITIIERRLNEGVGAAVVSGYKRSLEDRIDVVVVMAGDDQMDPSMLPRVLDPITGGLAEYAKGDRLSDLSDRIGMSRWRMMGNLVLTMLTRIASGYWGVADSQNGYTAISSSALRSIDLEKVYKTYAFENDMLVRLNLADARVTNVQMPARYGDEESKIRYASFIIRTSAFLLRSYVWRLTHKYIIRQPLNTSSLPNGSNDLLK